MDKKLLNCTYFVIFFGFLNVLIYLIYIYSQHDDKYQDKYQDKISKQTPLNELYKLLINPYCSYRFCDHHIGTEIYSHTPFGNKLKSNDILRNKNVISIKSNDVVLCEVNYFIYFVEVVLPILEDNKIKIILFTTQENMDPKMKQEDRLAKRSMNSDRVLKSESIILWVSQNPIYNNHRKYFAFPYGLVMKNLEIYRDFFIQHSKKQNKSRKINNIHQRPHGHIPKDHIRHKYKEFGELSGKMLPLKEFLSEVSKSYFFISTTGDRPDCYRHYECIGLDTIPISDIDEKYRQIFGNDMIYSHGDEMVRYLRNNGDSLKYHQPNKNIIYVDYWKDKINDRLKFLGCSRRLL